MKNRLFFVGTVVFLLFYNANSIEAQGRIVTNGIPSIYFVENNILTEYQLVSNPSALRSNNWEKITNNKLILPAETQFIFGFSDAFGLVSKGKFNKLYFPNDGRLFEFQELEFHEFSLPDGYEKIFYFYRDIICVIVEGKIKFYLFINNTWLELPQYEFSLPIGYSDAFGYLLGGFWAYLSIVHEGKIKFYEYKNDTWIESPEFEFNLPENYSKVIVYKNYYIGIVFDERIFSDTRILFYYPDDNNWHLEQSYRFSIRLTRR